MNLNNTTDTGAVVVTGGVSAAALVFLKTSLENMIPFLIVAAILIVVDLYFGIKAAKKRGDVVRASTALRKTIGKTFEYICWVTLAASIGVAFEFKALEWVILGLVLGNEVLSIAGNYFYIHGYKLEGFDLLKFIGKKAGVDTEGIKLEKIEENESNRKPTDKHD